MGCFLPENISGTGELRLRGRIFDVFQFPLTIKSGVRLSTSSEISTVGAIRSPVSDNSILDSFIEFIIMKSGLLRNDFNKIASSLEIFSDKTCEALLTVD